jgi:hypothetical protein
MRVLTYTDPHAWYERVAPFLLAREAEHNLMFGLAHALRHSPEMYPDFYLAVVVDDGGDVVWAALRTVPHNLLVSHVAHPDGLAALAEAVRQRYAQLSGVTASTSEAEGFAVAWQALSGQAHQVAMAQMIYALRRVIAPRPTAGQMRLAGAADVDVLTRWYHAFAVEAFPSIPPDPAAIGRWVAQSVAREVRRVWLWEVDGQPVALTGAVGPTPNGIRIGPVYTPPEHRGRGYASALVATQSQALLDEGRLFCFLYTDAANPTSNKIYQHIGYDYVCDATMMRFVDTVPVGEA